MRYFLRRILPVLFIGLVPVVAQAQILPACTVSGNCSGCDFITLGANVSEWILGVTSAVAVLMIIIGGLYWIISAGNPERVQRGQQIFIGAVIGISLVLGAYLIVNFSIASLLGDTGLDSTAQLYGTDWSSYCETGTAPAGSIVTDCSAEGVVDGSQCAADGCTDSGACVCDTTAGQCISACENQGDNAGLNYSCVSDETTCTSASGTVIDGTGGLCGANTNGAVCCST